MNGLASCYNHYFMLMEVLVLLSLKNIGSLYDPLFKWFGICSSMKY